MTLIDQLLEKFPSQTEEILKYSAHLERYWVHSDLEKLFVPEKPYAHILIEAWEARSKDDFGQYTRLMAQFSKELQKDKDFLIAFAHSMNVQKSDEELAKMSKTEIMNLIQN